VDILQGRQARQEMVALEDEPDLVVSDPRAFARMQAADGLTV